QTDLDSMETSVRAALAAEDSVSKTQPVKIDFMIFPDGVRITISYTSAYTGKPVAPITLFVN
ncbi:MAG: hypothetical protein JWO85_1626, partial [Candidatus Eremiobacteraeota bacterium]|nr:hypothetical protein [Candidatus Eremiobacteraeota bacterium]